MELFQECATVKVESLWLKQMIIKIHVWQEALLKKYFKIIILFINNNKITTLRVRKKTNVKAAYITFGLWSCDVNITSGQYSRRQLKLVLNNSATWRRAVQIDFYYPINRIIFACTLTNLLIKLCSLSTFLKTGYMQYAIKNMGALVLIKQLMTYQWKWALW